MWLIAGLGNPGDKHSNHRHNVGFHIVDAIADAHTFSNWSDKFKAQVNKGSIAGQDVLLMKPQTFMNESGQSVGEAQRFFKIPSNKILVCYDELDLALAKVRIKQNGGHGGHNGIKSIDSHVSDKNYWRLRFGIDHPGDKHRVSGYVLSDFAKAEQPKVEASIDDIARHIPLFFEQGHEKLMSKLALVNAA